MAVFNVGISNNGSSGGSGDRYGILVDRLSILEDSLSQNGNLSQGDYKVLQDEAAKLYGNPGLTNSQRSNIAVKIAGYQAAAGKASINNTQDITQLNNDTKNKNAQASIVAGNNPVTFLSMQAKAQSDRVAQLSDSIDQLNANGSDASTHWNEYNNALSDYQDTLRALDYVKSHQAGAAPTSDFVAYIDTNDRGEIRSVKVAKQGSQSGYLETNGLYGGLQIYGKLNHKENGKNTFILGNTKFSGADYFLPGPDGTFKNSVLFDPSVQAPTSTDQYNLAISKYTDINPTEVQTQKSVRPGDYVEGNQGVIYKMNPDGQTYTKYANTSPEKLAQAQGVDQIRTFKVPAEWENSINKASTQTDVGTALDQTIPMDPAVMGTINTNKGVQQYSIPAGPQLPSATANPSASSRPPAAPTSNSPATQGNVFSKTIESARGYLGRLFGG